MQVAPPLSCAAKATASAASRGSPSSSTSAESAPDSSRALGVSCVASRWAICRPTPVEPVKTT